MKPFLFLSILLSIALLTSASGAQEQEVNGFIVLNGEEQQQEDDNARRIQLNNPQLDIEKITSLFLTSNEISQLIQASEGLYTRPPTVEEVEREQKDVEKEKVRRPNSVREISLGGILYSSANDWSIWINSEKITPKNIPSVVMDISVRKDHIKLKWLDVQTNQIFPVKLKPNQRFNFDTRMFLPGK